MADLRPDRVDGEEEASGEELPVGGEEAGVAAAGVATRVASPPLPLPEPHPTVTARKTWLIRSKPARRFVPSTLTSRKDLAQYIRRAAGRKA